MITVYNKICSLNFPGNRFLLLTEMPNIDYMTIVGGEVTDIGMVAGSYFNQIQIEQDGVRRLEVREGRRPRSYDHTVEFNLVLPRIDTNIFTNSLRQASPCGIVALVVDNNSKAWIVGWNYTEAQKRGLILSQFNLSSTDSAAEHGMTYLLTRKNECMDLPLDDTLNTYLLDFIAASASPCQIRFASEEEIVYPGEGEIAYPGEGEIVYP